MSRVFIVDAERKPLYPCHPKRGRKLLEEGKAAVLRYYPFTIILKSEVKQDVQPTLRLKIDPGSKQTGIVLVDDKTGEIVWAAVLYHRGWQIMDKMKKRRDVRRNRRARKTRYRKARWRHRPKPKGWLAPSLMHRVYTTMTWIQRLMRYAPVSAISVELVSFDFQKMENPEIEGVEYQQGELHGYEVKEYLLEKWGRKCVYCGKEDRPLQVEHIQPKAKGGTNRISNLTLSCAPCNKKKSDKDIKVFLKKKPELLKKILRQAKAPLRDASAINSTRWCLYNRLKETGLPVETGSGGRTKFNRIKRGFSKTHWEDAACVGASTPENLRPNGVKPLYIKSMGHGSRKMMKPDKYGFPKAHRTRNKRFQEFQTGDLVKANVTKGTKKGVWRGRVTIRQKPSFMLKPVSGDHNGKAVDGFHPRYLKTLQKNDGYEYSDQPFKVKVPKAQ
jgi:hypothetical protein